MKKGGPLLSIKKASESADKILGDTLPSLRVGVSEKMIAKKIVGLTKKAGCRLSFYPIVAFGRWSAYPHHKSGRRRLRPGDLILIDLGAKYHGYCSDLTRTFTFGPPTPRQRERINLVLKAQHLAFKRIKPEISYREADRLIRSYFIANGIKPKALRHGLGHGIGRRVHESFTLSFKTARNGKLRVGDIFTVEPGIYFTGWGGVRIEDTVVLTKDGVKRLIGYSYNSRLRIKKRASHNFL